MEKEEENISVCIRVRPLNEREERNNHNQVLRCLPSLNAISITDSDGQALKGSSNVFQYDHIFGPEFTTEQIYDNVADRIISSILNGINATIFAYGQTSSGKTFSMQGTSDCPGILPLAVQHIFNYIEDSVDRDFLIRVSYVEIYNEIIRDLLVTDNDPSAGNHLKLREDPRNGLHLDRKEHIITDIESLLRLVKQGEQRRTVGQTAMNERSSRSHSIVRIVVESKAKEEEDDGAAVLVGELNLVDLAGSESLRHTGAEGQRQREAGNINRSLLTLSRVINSLAQGSGQNASFRDSKLTRLLQKSLAGNTRTLIVCCVTSSDRHLEETKSTLQFAARAKNIRTSIKVNEVLDDQAQLKRLKDELNSLRQQLKDTTTDDVSALRAENEALELEKERQQMKITRLKSLILHGTAQEDKIVPRRVSGQLKSKRCRETWGPGDLIKSLEALNTVDTPNPQPKKRASVGTEEVSANLSFQPVVEDFKDVIKSQKKRIETLEEKLKELQDDPPKVRELEEMLEHALTTRAELQERFNSSSHKVELEALQKKADDSEQDQLFVVQEIELLKQQVILQQEKYEKKCMELEDQNQTLLDELQSQKGAYEVDIETQFCLLNEQMRALPSQESYQDKVRDLVTLQQEMQSIQSDNDELRQSLGDTMDELSRLKMSEGKESESEDLRLELQSKTVELEQLSAAMEIVLSEKEEMEIEANEQRQVAEKELMMLQSEKEQLVARLETENNLMERLKAELVESKEQLRAENQLEALVCEQQQQKEVWESEKQDFIAQLAQIQTELTEKQKDYEEFKEFNTQAESQVVSRLENEISEQRQQFETLESEKQELMTRIAQFETELVEKEKELKEKITVMETEVVSRLENEVSEEKQRCEILESEKQEFESQIAQFETELEEKEKQVEQLKEKTTLMETEVVSRLENEVSETKEQLESEKQELNARIAEFETELVKKENEIEELKEKTTLMEAEVVSRLENEVSEEKQRRKTLESEKQELKTRIAQFETELVEKEKELKRKTIIVETEVVSRLENEVSEVKEQLETLESEKQELESRFAQTETELVEKTKQVEQLKEKTTLMKTEVISRLENEASEAKERMESEKQLLNTRVSQIETELIEKEKEIKQLKEKTTSMETEVISGLENGISEAKERLENEKQQLNTRIAQFETELVKKEKEIEELKEKTTLMETEVISRLENEVSEQKQLIETLESEKAMELTEKEKERMEIVSRLENEVSKQKQLIETLESEKQQVTTRFGQIEMELNEKTKEMEILLSQMKEQTMTVSEQKQLMESEKHQLSTRLGQIEVELAEKQQQNKELLIQLQEQTISIENELVSRLESELIEKKTQNEQLLALGNEHEIQLKEQKQQNEGLLIQIEQFMDQESEKQQVKSKLIEIETELQTEREKYEKEKNEQVFQFENELKDQKEQNEGLMIQIEQLLDQTTILDGEKQTFVMKLEELQREKQQWMMKLSQTQSLEDENSALLNQIEQLNVGHKELLLKLSETQARKEEAEAVAIELKQQTETASAEQLNEAIERIETLRNENDQLTLRLEQDQEKLTVLTDELESMNELETQLEMSKTALDQLEREKYTLSETLMTEQDNVRQVEKEKQDLLQAYEHIESESASNKMQLEDLTRQVEGYEKQKGEIESLTRQLNEAPTQQSDVSELSKRLEHAMEDNDALTTTVDQLKDLVLEKQTQLNDMELRLTEQVQMYQKLEEFMAKSQGESEFQQVRHEEVENELEMLRLEKQELETLIQAKDERIEKLDKVKMTQDVFDSMLSIKMQNKTLKAKVAALEQGKPIDTLNQQALQDEKRRVQELKQSNIALETERGEMQRQLEQYDALKQKNMTLESEKNGLQQQLDKYETTMHRVKDLEMRIKFLEEENYNLLTEMAKKGPSRAPMQPLENIKPIVSDVKPTKTITPVLDPNESMENEKPGNCDQQ